MPSEVDKLDISCTQCPLITPGLTAFMRTMSREVMIVDVEDDEMIYAATELLAQAGEAVEEFCNEMLQKEDMDFVSFVEEGHRRFGPAMQASLDQAEANFEEQRDNLDQLILEAMPGKLVCRGLVQVGDNIYCGATRLAASSESAREKQQSILKLNDEFVNRAVND